MKKPIVVMVELLTDHPLLDPDAVNVGTTESTAALRKAIVDSLPGLVGVVAVFPKELAMLMSAAHFEAAKQAGIGDNIRFPPDDYVPPWEKRRS